MQKKLHFMSLVIFGLALTLPAFAQKPKDPFTRKNVEAETEEKAPIFKNLYTSYEFIRLPKNVVADWQTDPKMTGRSRRELAAKLINEGKAELIDSTILPARSGQSVKFECNREIMVPAEFAPRFDFDPNGPRFPIFFDPKKVGLEVGLDLILHNDNVQITGIGSLSRSAILREDVTHHPRDGKRTLITDMIQPTIAKLASSESGELKVGEYAVTGVLEPLAGAAAYQEPLGTVIFVRTALLEARMLPAPKSGPNVKFVADLIEVNASEWHEWLYQHEIGDAVAQVPQLADQWLEEGKAKRLKRLVLASRSGQQATAESIEEVSYPTYFAEPIRLGGPCDPDDFKNRNIGFRIEMDPLVGPAIDLNFKTEWSMRGPNTCSYRKSPAEGAEGPWLPAVQFPSFFVNRITTSLTVEFGQELLAGVFTPQDPETGGSDASKKVLMVFRDVSGFDVE